MNNKHLAINLEIKADGDAGKFTAYGNVKNVLDLAGDVSVDGCFKKSIEAHKQKGTMPKMLLQHDKNDVIGVWKSMEEDSKGLKMTGQLCLDTQAGKETYALIKMGALDSLSIGYITIKESYDTKTGVNYLEELDVKETSIVTFACNDASLIESVKSNLKDGIEPTIRELQKALQDLGFSKRKAESIVNSGYKSAVDQPLEEINNTQVVDQLKSLNSLFK